MRSDNEFFEGREKKSEEIKNKIEFEVKGKGV
jgi:hypothetical protein